MKWKAKNKPQIKEGDTRIKKRFLFFPQKLSNEWRWLECALIEQKVMSRTKIMEGSVGCFQVLEWVSVGWVNNRRARG